MRQLEIKPMIHEFTHNLHRWLFGRCQGCSKRLGTYPARVYGYEWNGWLRSEVGLWHVDCLEKQMKFDWDMRSRLETVEK
jgi:hypothetical protein